MGVLADTGLFVRGLGVVLHAAEREVIKAAAERLLEVAAHRLPARREVEVGINHLHRANFWIDRVG